MRVSKLASITVWNHIRTRPSTPPAEFQDGLLEKANKENTPIILITDDMKEDWWKISHGKTIGPRPELRREMYERAGVDFYIYNFDNFLEHVSRILDDRGVSKKVDEIRKDVREYHTARDIAEEVYNLRQSIQECESRLNWLIKEAEQINREKRFVEDSHPKYGDDISDIELRKKISDLDNKRNEIGREMDRIYSVMGQYKERYRYLRSKYSHLFPEEENSYKLFS